MGKWVSVIVSGVIGAVLAVVAAFGVVSANTAAPSHNPASAPIVNYGNSK